MKKLIALLLVLNLIVPAFSITRDKLYQYFGPILIEAVVLVIKDEINILRDRAGLPERTNEQLIDALQSKYETLSKYDWMDIRQ